MDVGLFDIYIQESRLLNIFMLNSVEHEILNALKYKTMKIFGLFSVQISLEWYFSCS